MDQGPLANRSGNGALPDSRRQAQRDSVALLIALLLMFACLLITAQVATMLGPSWRVAADMLSKLNPDEGYSVTWRQPIEPLRPEVLTPPAWNPEELLTRVIEPTMTPTGILIPTPTRRPTDTPTPTPTPTATPTVPPTKVPTVIVPSAAPSSTPAPTTSPTPSRSPTPTQTQTPTQTGTPTPVPPTPTSTPWPTRPPQPPPPEPTRPPPPPPPTRPPSSP